MKDLRIVFMGTPDFAVAILDKLVVNGANIVAVITSPDKPAGRGLKMHESAVKQYVIAHQLPLLQPTNLKEETFISELKALSADLFVVVAFRMLPEIVWSMPPLGTINLHASILPHYRGAAPINWAIINGEKETGVTTFFIEKEIDTGKIIERSTVSINENETVGELHDRLMELGANTTLSTVKKIAKGNVQGIPQIEFEEGELKSAPKIFKEDCKVNFSQSAQKVHNFIRGLSPYPAAWCTVSNGTETKSFKLFASLLTNIKPTNSKIAVSKDGILFPCADYYVLITELQPEGKRRMDYKSFLAGNSLEGFTV
ncbi:MAG: methionyl-tRNA formyltransferase [Crocinitomicaceae bacterium]|nr:methionyl-tRNA formyltransferase [Crocinitomicaceae bacterium]